MQLSERTIALKRRIILFLKGAAVLIYFLIAFLASCVGAISGMGGGIIIKPVMDALTRVDAGTVSIISSACVFTMAVVSVGKHAHKKTRFPGKMSALLGAGALFGSMAGRELLQMLIAGRSDASVKTLQGTALLILLTFTFLYMNFLKGRYAFHVQNSLIVILVGIMLGLLSAFIGIGGGPFNVAFLCLFFGMNMKDATVSSLVVIFLAQISVLGAAAARGTFSPEHLPILLFMLPGALLGGICGTACNRKFTNENLMTVYNSVLIIIGLINVYNIISYSVLQ